MEQLFETLIELDQQVLLYLHGLSSPWMDVVMAGVTEKYNWLPLYLLLFIILFKNFGWQGIYTLVAVVILITLSDQLTSSFMKPFFHRFRPCHDPEIGHLVRIVTKCGGYFGFVSSHASNSFAVATYFWLIFHNKYRWMIWLLVWPVIVSYSRIYLGVHYPLDILGGAIVGIVLGYLVYRMSKWSSTKIPFVFVPIKN